MKNTHLYHYFLDEAGDTTFYGKGKVPIMGKEGVSQTFMLCMVSFKTPLAELKESILLLAKKISESAYYKDVPSVVKRLEKGNFYFHAKDDLPEIRKEFFAEQMVPSYGSCGISPIEPCVRDPKYIPSQVT